MADLGTLELKLAEIKRDYVASLTKRSADLQAVWTQAQSDSWQRASVEELHRLVHTLTGSGATFGFTELSEQARALELPLKELLQDPSLPHDALPALYESLLEAIAAVAEQHD